MTRRSDYKGYLAPWKDYIFGMADLGQSPKEIAVFIHERLPQDCRLAEWHKEPPSVETVYGLIRHMLGLNRKRLTGKKYKQRIKALQDEMERLKREFYAPIVAEALTFEKPNVSKIARKYDCSQTVLNTLVNETLVPRMQYARAFCVGLLTALPQYEKYCEYYANNIDA